MTLSLNDRIRIKMANSNLPYEGTFELTPRCTMNCKMCYVVLSEQQQKKLGKELDGAQWLEIAQQAVEHGMISALLTGGEPFLHKDFFEILNGINAMGVSVKVNSNATMITPQTIEKLKKCKPTRMNVSLYGGTNEAYESLCGLKNGFDIASAGIDRLLDAGMDVKLNFTATELNVKDVELVKKFADDRKIPVQVSSYIFRSVDGNDSLNLEAYSSMKNVYDFDSYFISRKGCIREGKKLKARMEAQRAGAIPYQNRECVRCGAGRGTFAVRWNGEMMPCILLKLFGEYPLEIGFAEAWSRMNKAINEVRLPKECGKCEYAPVCHVCAAQIYEKTGKLDVLDKSLCELAKTSAEILLSYADIEE